MSQIKAFVGHSFPSDEDAVVQAFLKFLGQVKAMNIGFNWDHTEVAEPKELADKVMRLIEDKNLFIGICANKELTVAPSKLERGFFNKKILKGDETQFSAKTSDWIIQEIGLAIGRKEEEEKKEKETIEKGAPLGEFYREYGLAASKDDVSNIVGTWDSERCPLKLEIKNDKLVAEGTYERETLTNIFALSLGGGGTTTSPKGTKYSVRYEGIVSGHTVKGSISIEEVGKPAKVRSLLSDVGNSKEVLMIVSDNLQEMQVLEKGVAYTERFYALTAHKL